MPYDLPSAGGIRYSVWVSIRSAPVCFYPITNRKWPDRCSPREGSISHWPALPTDPLFRFPLLVQLDTLCFHVALMCSSRGQRVAFRRFWLPDSRRTRRTRLMGGSVLTGHQRLLLATSSPKQGCSLCWQGWICFTVRISAAVPPVGCKVLKNNDTVYWRSGKTADLYSLNHRNVKSDKVGSVPFCCAKRRF